MEKIGTKKTRVGRYALCLLLVIGLASCDTSGLKDAADNFAVVVKLEPINTNSTVLLTDAKTGELITKKVKATFSGPNGSDVIDMYSDPMSDKSVDSGVLNFGIRNAVTPTDGSPAKVQLTLEADGYETTTRTVSIDSVGDSKFLFKMINKNNPPQGVQFVSNTDAQAANDGTIQQDVQVNVKSEGQDTLASLKIPKGTVFKDADGNTLSGQLTTKVTYYNATEPEAMESIPTEMVTKDGEQLVTFGTFSLQITDTQGDLATSASLANAKAKTSANSAQMEFKMLLDNNIFSSMSGGGRIDSTEVKNILNILVSNGAPSGRVAAIENYYSQISGISYHLKGGQGNDLSQWSKKYISAAMNAGILESDTTSFQSPNREKLVTAAFNTVNTCDGSITLNRSGYTGSITGTANISGYSKTLSIPSGVNSYKGSFPDFNLKYKLKTSYGTVTGSHNFCNGGDLNITLPQPPSNLIDATVDVTLMCQNPDEAVRVTDIPGASVLYRKKNAPSGTPWKQATNLQWEYNEDTQKLTGGSFDVSGVEKGQDYTFKTTYQNNTYQKTITITGKTVDYSKTITDDICQ